MFWSSHETERINLGDFGATFSTRARARGVVSAAGVEQGSTTAYVIDFARVTHLSGSFADELLRHFAATPALEGFETDAVKQVVEAVAERRAAVPARSSR